MHQALNPQTLAGDLHALVETQLAELPAFIVPHMTMPGFAVRDRMIMIYDMVAALIDWPPKCHGSDPTSVIAMATIRQCLGIASSVEVSRDQLQDAVDLFIQSIRATLESASTPTEQPF